MSDSNYDEYNNSEYVVDDNDENIFGGNYYESSMFGGVSTLLSSVIIILIVMVLLSFFMPQKQHKLAKSMHNHIGCANHGKVFDDLLVPSNFYDSKQEGFKYINWNSNS